tara:strand:+ start:682 stop:879 length:198 start_codon:yes stop_codon:yes gene_type:complete
METVDCINILFFGGGRRVTLAKRIIQSGIKSNININVNVSSYEIDKNQPISLVGEIMKRLKLSDK